MLWPPELISSFRVHAIKPQKYGNAMGLLTNVYEFLCGLNGRVNEMVFILFFFQLQQWLQRMHDIEQSQKFCE